MTEKMTKCLLDTKPILGHQTEDLLKKKNVSTVVEKDSYMKLFIDKVTFR
jgi:hypothetical protein